MSDTETKPIKPPTDQDVNRGLTVLRFMFRALTVLFALITVPFLVIHIWENGPLWWTVFWLTLNAWFLFRR